MKAPPPLDAWSNFYVMTGSAGATLIGLMFVVMTLVTDSNRARRSEEGTSIFSTPTVVHFACAVLSSAVLLAPWPTLRSPSIVFLGMGLLGSGYIARNAYRIRRLTSYSADLEDWTWHTFLPLCSYVALGTAAVLLTHAPRTSLSVIALAVLMLVFIGIHNAWDIVTFVAVKQPQSSGDTNEESANPMAARSEPASSEA